MKIHEKLDQNTDAWRDIRAGKLTASNAQAIGTAGKGLETLVYQTLAEKYSSGEYDTYANKHMDRGHELEDMASDVYELETGKKTVQVGFVELDEYTGCSPDRFIDEDGLLEIKCPDDPKHFKTIVNGESEIDSKYHWQMQMQMLVTGRKYCIFASYNPNFEKSLITFRIELDPVKQEKLKLGLEEGKKMLQEIESKLK